MIRRYILRDDEPPAAWRLALSDEATFACEVIIYAGDDTVENHATGLWHEHDGVVSLTATSSDISWLPVGTSVALRRDRDSLWRGRYELTIDPG
jgi:hypothetical protein